MEKAQVDLRRLRYFIAVCDHGGFSRASGSVGIAQPALTRQIKLLEKELGLSLINRSGRGAEPTDEGRALLSGSRRSIAELDDLVRQIRQRSSRLSGEAVLGVCPTIAPFFLDEVVRHVRDNHPKLSLSVIEAYSGDLQNLMARGKLDVALTYRPSAPKGLDVTELFSERMALVTAFAPEADSRPLALHEIGGLKLILPSGIHELRRIIDRVCVSRGVVFTPEIELDSLDAVKSMVSGRSGSYATILPSYSVRREVAERALSAFEIDDPDMQRTIAVVVPRHARNAPIPQFLTRHVRGVAAMLKQRLDVVF